MNYGDVFYWETDQVFGYDQRLKYHVYVCCTDHLYGETFLVINKRVDPNDFEVTVSDIHCLTYNPSYISCASPIDYTLEELAGVDGDPPIASLTRETLIRLRDHIDRNRTMPREHKARIVRALMGIK